KWFVFCLGHVSLPLCFRDSGVYGCIHYSGKSFVCWEVLLLIAIAITQGHSACILLQMDVDFRACGQINTSALDGLTYSHPSLLLRIPRVCLRLGCCEPGMGLCHSEDAFRMPVRVNNDGVG